MRAGASLSELLNQGCHELRYKLIDWQNDNSIVENDLQCDQLCFIQFDDSCVADYLGERSDALFETTTICSMECEAEPISCC